MSIVLRDDNPKEKTIRYLLAIIIGIIVLMYIVDYFHDGYYNKVKVPTEPQTLEGFQASLQTNV